MSDEEDQARSMITQWAVGAPGIEPVGAKPLKERYAQFLRDKANARILSHYAHPFGYCVRVFDAGATIYEKEGRVDSAAALLDVFLAEAQAAMVEFGETKLATFAPTRA